MSGEVYDLAGLDLDGLATYLDSLPPTERAQVCRVFVDNGFETLLKVFGRANVRSRRDPKVLELVAILRAMVIAWERVRPQQELLPPGIDGASN